MVVENVPELPNCDAGTFLGRGRLMHKKSMDHQYDASPDESLYCWGAVKEKLYLTHLCPGCMTYLDQPDLPCQFCGWKQKDNANVRSLLFCVTL